MALVRTALRHAARAAVRAYPFYSGGFRLSNSAPVRWLVGAGVVQSTLSCGARLEVRLDDMDGRTVYLLGDQDRKLTWLFRQVVRPGDTALDIGANCGSMALELATLVGKSGRVHAFEPQAALAEALAQAARANGLEQLQVHPIGLSTATESAALTLVPGFSGLASLHGLPPWADAGAAIRRPVQLRAASAYLNTLEIQRLRLVKIDVEGHEAEVLKGAADFFARVRPEVIVFEHNRLDPPNTRSAAGARSAAFWSDPGVALLQSWGYRLAAVQPRTLRRTVVRVLSPNVADIGAAENFVALAPGPGQPELLRALVGREV